MTTPDQRVSMDERLRTDYGWTPRQRQVLELLAAGRSNPEIADYLGISRDGAKYHISEVLSKLGADSREEAAEYWRRHQGLRPRFARVFRSIATSAVLKWGAAVVALGGAAVVAAAAVLTRDDGVNSAPSASTPPSSAYQLKPGTFVRVGQPAESRSLHGSVVLPDVTVLIMGGNVAGRSSAQPLTASVERFDLKTMEFEPFGELLQPRQFFEAAVLADGRVLVAGGVGRDGPLASAELFDPATGTSTPVDGMSVPRAGFGAAVLKDGRVLVAGGGADEKQSATTEIFDPANRRFVHGPALTAPRREPRALLLPDGDVLVVSDGSAERYDTATNSFRSVSTANLPEVPVLFG